MSFLSDLLSPEGRPFPDRASKAPGMMPLGTVGTFGCCVPLTFLKSLKAHLSVVCLALNTTFGRVASQVVPVFLAGFAWLGSSLSTFGKSPRPGGVM